MQIVDIGSRIGVEQDQVGDLPGLDCAVFRIGLPGEHACGVERPEGVVERLAAHGRVELACEPFGGDRVQVELAVRGPACRERSASSSVG